MGLGEEAYGAAKAGMVNLTQNTAIRYGEFNVRANCIAPGTVDTPIWNERKKVNPNVMRSWPPGTPWAGSVSRRTSPTPRSSSFLTRRPGSPASCCRSTAVSPPGSSAWQRSFRPTDIAGTEVALSSGKLTTYATVAPKRSMTKVLLIDPALAVGMDQFRQTLAIPVEIGHDELRR